MKRRTLLKSAAIAAPLLAAPAVTSWLSDASGQAAPVRRKVITVLALGGWDTTYAIDPKPGLTTVDAPSGSIERFSEIPVFTDPSRPLSRQFFERWSSRAAVIRGVQVRSFVHPDCLKRVLTGSASETTPDFGAIAGFELGRDLPVPYLAMGTQGRSGPLSSITGRTGTTNQLSTLVNPDLAYAAPGTGGPATGLLTSAEEEEQVRAYLTASALRLQSVRGSTGYNGRRIDDFVNSLPRADRLVDFARTSFREQTYTLDLASQIPLAVEALREGLSHSALIELSGFDTHQGNLMQTNLQEAFFSGLDRLMTELETSDLLDSTTVVVMSEMGRTPKLNGDGGKDHWPVTTAMVLGAGVRGGVALGGTDDAMSALSLNLETGAVDSAGSQLQTSNLVAGILTHLGVDPEPYLPGISPFVGFSA